MSQRQRVVDAYGPDPYLGCLTYRSTRCNAVLNLRYEQPSPRKRFIWFFSFGEKLEFGPFRNKLDAIIRAAHKLGMSGKQADFDPML